MIKSIQFKLRQELVLCMLSSHTQKNPSDFSELLGTWTTPFTPFQMENERKKPKENRKLKTRSMKNEIDIFHSLNVGVIFR